MKTLTSSEIHQVAGGFPAILGTFGGAIIGACLSQKFITDAEFQVYWLGVVPAPTTLAGAFVGGAVGSLISNLGNYFSVSTPT